MNRCNKILQLTSDSYPKTCAKCGLNGCTETLDLYMVTWSVSVHHEGDERSRTHPGHGYPAHTTTEQKFKIVNGQDALKAEIAMHDRYHEKTQCYKIQPVQVKTETIISIV